MAPTIQPFQFHLPVFECVIITMARVLHPQLFFFFFFEYMECPRCHAVSLDKVVNSFVPWEDDKPLALQKTTGFGGKV